MNGQAPELSVPHPKVPPLQVRKLPDWQVTRPSAKSLDVEAVPEMVKLVEVAFARVTLFVNVVLAPANVFVSVRSDEEAAVIVIESPLLKLVLLMVPSEPVMNPAPTEVVETTDPSALVERSAFARFKMPRFEVVAFVLKRLPAVRAVEEAYGNVLAALVDVAVKMGAVTVSYAVTAFLKSDEPVTSMMLPVVVVAVLPRRRTREVTDG